MKINHLFLLLLSFFLFFFSFKNEAYECSHYVLVSVAPHKYFVEKIVGKTAKVGLMVPAGASAHTFEPTPRQMIEASQADIWFQVGETFEKKATAALKSYNSHLQIIDLRQNLELIPYDPSQGHCCCHHHESSYDLHFWLSPQLAKIQAQTIAKTLIQSYPEHAEEYRERLFLFQKEMDDLDFQIRELLKKSHNDTIMVSHPAYAYFCRDYGCVQLSIEFEGKDPTPQQLTRLLTQARQRKIKTVFIQMQYPSKGARLIASQLGLNVITLDPYSENYPRSLLEIAKAVADQGS